MSASTWFLIGMACAVPFALILLRANGDDTDAEQAADSMRQSLDADSRFDELRTYTTTNHVRAGTAYGKAIK